MTDQAPPNDDELLGLDPVSLMDAEAARLEAYLSQLSPDGWQQASRCDGWSVRDVAAHLVASERYHHACLSGSVAELFQEMTERGATDIDAFNQVGIADQASLSNDELVAAFHRADAETREGFRARGDGQVDTSVGLYPARWQAFHLAGELATHADDVFVPVLPEEHRARRDWRARFSRFALMEHRPALTASGRDGCTRVVGDGLDFELGDEVFVEAVAGRAEGLELDDATRAALSTMP